MLTRNDIQFIKSLADKRARDEAGVFVVEGRKALDELSGFAIRHIYKVHENISAREMSRISFLTTPTDVLAVVEKPRYGFEPAELRGRLVLALDEVQNPGNVGTIVRLADWFGIEDVLCSGGCADVFGPKVVQATMGSLARVRVHYGELAEMIPAIGRNADGDSAESSPQTEPLGSETSTSVKVYGAFLEGENIYRAPLSGSGIVVLGSEGRGISAEVERLVTRRLVIPRLGGGESLNVGVAAAIICSEFSRSECNQARLNCRDDDEKQRS